MRPQGRTALIVCYAICSCRRLSVKAEVAENLKIRPVAHRAPRP